MKKIVISISVLAVSGFTASAVTGNFIYSGIVFGIAVIAGFVLVIKSTPNKRYV